MNKFSTKDLAEIIGAAPTADTKRTAYFIRVNTDSRSTKVGDCFFAIIGENFDGHDYINNAFDKGASCAVVSRDIDVGSHCLLKVNNTIKALGDFAASFRKQNSFKVVAITGSVGKTTVRQIVHHVLSQHYSVHQAPKNFNNNIGLPLTLLGADTKDQIVIAEVGTNHPGEIAALTKIALPDIAVLTNVYPAHLEGLGDINAIKKEKLSIAQGLSPGGILIINSAVEPPAELSVKTLTFSTSDAANFRAHNISLDGPISRFAIDRTDIYLPLPGIGNIENALAAWAVCSQFDIKIDDFAQAVKTLSAVPMRTELLQIGTITVLNDCYNANPASMKNALDILAELGKKEKRRTVFICGDMAELGSQSNQLHADIGAAVAQTEVKMLLTVGESAKIIADAANNAANYDLQTNSFPDTLSSCNNLQKFIKDSDIVLVKGSRTNKLEMAVKKLKELFE